MMKYGVKILGVAVSVCVAAAMMAACAPKTDAVAAAGQIVVLAPSGAPTATETALPAETVMVTPAATVTPAPMESVIPTATDTPAPTESVTPKATDTPTPTESVTPTATATPKPTASPQHTATPTPAEEVQPPLLTKMLEKYGLSADKMDCTQMLMLAYAPGQTKLYLYDKNSAGYWKLARSFAANVGKNGVTDNKKEGDKATPTGCYGMGFAFGIQAKPDTGWTYRQVTPNSYWVDDPDSAHYNTWVEGTADKDWDSAEHLIDKKTAYAYALVIDYNTDPPVPGKGSAIFLHVGDHPTVGCISVAQDDVLTILKWLKKGSRARILIADAE